MQLPSAAPHAVSSVLVVDDNEDAAATVAELLDLSGFATRISHTGEQALELAAAFRPDAVLLDIGLPGIDGYEVCRRIRAGGAGSRQPVVVALTGWGQQSDRAAAIRAGFDAHLTKPADVELLLTTLRRLLTRNG